MLPIICSGGYMMVPLVVLSLLSFAIIFERWSAYRKADIDTGALLREVLGLIAKGEGDNAILLCRNTPGPVSAILLVGLQRFVKLRQLGRPAEIMDEMVTKAMTDYAPQVVEVLENRLNLLAMIATVAPLLGMTGTVTGMINAFQSISEQGQMDAQIVAAGISEALITTAAGLIIAIPAVVLYSVYTRRVERYVLQIEEATAKLVDQIATTEQA